MSHLVILFILIITLCIVILIIENYSKILSDLKVYPVYLLLDNNIP